MTTARQRAQARRQDALITRLTPALRRAVAKEKNRFIRQAAEDYRRTGHFNANAQQEHESNIRAILKAHYLRVGKILNAEVFTAIKNQVKHLEIKAVSAFDFLLRRWAEREAARKAIPIAGTTRDDLNRAVQKAFAAEAPELTVIRDILAVRGYSNWRADAVARTETHNAAMYASQTTAEEFAKEAEVVIYKQWSPTLDDRTRTVEKNQAGHAEMENYPAIPMNELFEVPAAKGGTDKMERPGDPNAPAEQVINCRCVLTYVTQ